MGDGRAEGLSAIGYGRKAAISLTPNVVGIHIYIFESLQFKGLYVGTYCMGFVTLNSLIIN